MPKTYTDYRKFKDEDGVEHEESIVRCYVCLDTIVATNGKRNSSYNEKRQYFTNNGNPTYVEIVVCNECFNKPLPSPSVLAQTIKDSERAVMKRHDMPADKINKAINKHFNLVEITDVYFLKSVESQVKKQEMIKKIRNVVKDGTDKIKNVFRRTV